MIPLGSSLNPSVLSGDNSPAPTLQPDNGSGRPVPSCTEFVRYGRKLDARRWLWPFTAPLRHYVMRPPQTALKRFLIRRGLPSVLPRPPACLMVLVPGGGKVKVDYGEEIALLLLLHGSYEAAELESLARFAKPGTTAVDVGANIGMYTVPLATAVGDAGTVLAFEPVPQTLEKLRSNIALNGLVNVVVVAAAAADGPGVVDLRLANDSAYASLVRVKHDRGTGTTLAVPAVTIDQVWEERNRPTISFCKIDVEGAELLVLKGAEDVLRACRPALLLEADPGPLLDSLVSWLGERGYKRSPQSGFVPWNHLFVWGG
jgi:FkbM family methyltransferase